MAAKPFGASFGTSWSPSEDEDEELSLEGSISMDGEDRGDDEG